MIYFFVVLFSVVLSWLFFKPYLPLLYAQKIRGFKEVLIVGGTTIVLFWIVVYFMVFSEPEALGNAAELLQKDESVMAKIGDYESYAYYKYDLPKEKDNPANIKISLNGSEATVYISCKIVKDTLGKWRLIQVHQDSLVKRKN